MIWQETKVGTNKCPCFHNGPLWVCKEKEKKQAIPTPSPALHQKNRRKKGNIQPTLPSHTRKQNTYKIKTNVIPVDKMMK